MNNDSPSASLSFHDWAVVNQDTPGFVIPVSSDCSLPDYIADPASGEAGELRHGPRAAASYRCYLLACLDGLNELYWAHCRGESVDEVVARSLDNCFASGQCWRFVAPLLDAAIEDLPSTVGERVGAEDAWDWVDAAFQDGLKTGQIYDFNVYRGHAAAICRALVAAGWADRGVSLEGLLHSEGLSGCSSVRVQAIVALELARYLGRTGRVGAAKALLAAMGTDKDSVLQSHSPATMLDMAVNQGVEATFALLTDQALSKARRSSGAISSAVFRTLGAPI